MAAWKSPDFTLCYDDRSAGVGKMVGLPGTGLGFVGGALPQMGHGWGPYDAIGVLVYPLAKPRATMIPFLAVWVWAHGMVFAPG